MTVKVYRSILGNQITSKAPPPLRGQVELRRFDQEHGTFTLLVFPSQRKDRVLSGPVQHVLSELPPEHRLVAFGGCFTLEALALLKDRAAEVFALSEFPWTDERWNEIRTSIATGVKRPPSAQNG